MLRIIIGYMTFANDVQFLAVKQAVVHDPLWRTAFYVHVFSAVVALFAGFTQFSKLFFKEHRQLHRTIGKIYTWNILFINFPFAMILALNANGQLTGRVAFVLLDTLWAYFTFKAVASAKKRDFQKHKDNMIRSYALTFSAITLRSWHVILIRYFAVDGVQLYAMEAWLGFLPNLLIAEFIIRWGYLLKSPPK